MITIHVKTLDGSNRQFEVSADLTITQFKEHIAPTVNIPAVDQRLIYHGRVLQEEQILNTLDLDGKTLHLVKKALNQAGNSQNNANFPIRHEIPGIRQIVINRVFMPSNLAFNQFPVPGAPGAGAPISQSTTGVRPPQGLRPQFETRTPIMVSATVQGTTVPNFPIYMSPYVVNASATPLTAAGPRQNVVPPGQSRDSNDATSLTGAQNNPNLTSGQPAENQPTNVPSVSTARKNDHVTDNWKENVPREWVPIIEEDMEKQTNTEIQRPFSDAYLNGMHSKRRKLICDNKPNLHSDSEILLRQMIQNSLTEGGVCSSNVSQSADDVVTSLKLRPDLVQSFESSLREKIRSRTECDPDFDENRFENVKKMLDSSK